MTHIPTRLLLPLVTLGLIGLSVVSGGVLRADIVSDCAGKPYGSPGCPLKASSASTGSDTCGNGVVETGEECDDGSRRNGNGSCSDNCTILYCGDGLISPGLKEECEPEKDEIYAVDPDTGELLIEVRYLVPVCGPVCTAPACDENGDCTGGCTTSFQPACVHESAGASSQASLHTDVPFQQTATVDDTQDTAVSSAAAEAGVSASESSPVQEGVHSCGNGVIDSGEECDDGNQTNGDACTNTCRRAICGDGVVALWEECDDGNRVAFDGCSNTCRLPRCGDGVVQEGEKCDDGNRINEDACTNRCALPHCGDGITQAKEECDDANDIENDGCNTQCRLPRCGDGIVHESEQCDDGNSVNNDGCSNVCTLPHCGDGIKDVGEECDDGNAIEDDGCNNVCRLPHCGNGVREGGEECDDGNQSNYDLCTNMCDRSRCGDGFLQQGEFCDDGNDSNDDSCSTNCRVPTCGDGSRHPREECDEGPRNSDNRPDACRMDCRASRCGDAVTDAGEECDGGEDCAVDCRLLKPAAPLAVDEPWDIPVSTQVATGLAGVSTATTFFFAFRKRFMEFIREKATEKVEHTVESDKREENANHPTETRT